MKTVSALLLATLALGAAAFAGPKVPKTKLLDMYAAKEGDSYVVHRRWRHFRVSERSEARRRDVQAHARRSRPITARVEVQRRDAVQPSVSSLADAARQQDLLAGRDRAR